MDYKMRRKDRELTAEEAIRILAGQSHGILSCVDQDEQPYGVPLSYYYQDHKIYFHCANEGHKLDSIRNNNRVAFTVVSKDEPVIDERKDYTTKYASAIAFGQASIVTDDAERALRIKQLTSKYFDDLSIFETNMNDFFAQTTVVALTIDKISGKANK